MIKQEIRKPKVQKRHRSIRVKLSGTSEFPRLAVYRSTKHIYAQLIDDVNHVTLASASSNDKDLKEKLAHGGNIEAAKVVGEAIAQKARQHLSYFLPALPALRLMYSPSYLTPFPL